MRHRSSFFYALNAIIATAFFLLNAALLRAKSDPLPPPVVPDGFGVNIHFTHFQPDELKLYHDAGFHFIRMDLGWDSIEKSPGVYDFSNFDTLLSDLDSVHARALLIFDYSNQLYDQGLSPYTDAGRAAFARYAAAAAAHFAGRGVIWEIYNEPNGGFWKPKASAEAYGELIKATVSAVRKADPNAVILGGAIAGIQDDYIEELLRSGSLDHVDALSVHPYRGDNPETSAFDFDRIRALIARYTPKGKSPLPIVCSEWGYTSATGNVSEQQQASYAVREYLSNLANGVDLTIYYDWKNDGTDQGYTEDRFGTLTENLVPKPAYNAIKSLNSSLNGYTFRHRLSPSESNDWRLLFEGPSDLALVEWSSKSNGTDAPLPVVTKIEPGDSSYVQLKRIASIQYAPNTLVAMSTSHLPLPIRVMNTESSPAAIVVGTGKSAVKLNVPAGESRTVTASLSADLAGDTQQFASPSITWNGEPVAGIQPLTIMIGSLLQVNIAPMGADLSVDVINPLNTSFNGSIAFAPAAGAPVTKQLSVAAGQTETIEFAGAANGGGVVTATDKEGDVLSRAKIGHFLPLAEWPTSANDASGYSDEFYLANAANSNSAAPAVAGGAGAPSQTVVNFPYESGPEWRYYTLSPAANVLIPAGATAMSMWANGDGSGVAIHARFVDETGQMFQPDAGLVKWTGWRPINLSLTGKNTAHWGGANDGIPHGQLRWNALALIDCGNMPSRKGTIQLAGPEYLMP